MRLEMSIRTDLALRALAHLHETGPSTGTNLAAAIETTVNYLPQVLKPLVLEGWIHSTRGPGGGYRLSTELTSLTVLEVIEAMEGAAEDNRCVLRGAPCPVPEPCALHEAWVRARGALLRELGLTSVATTFGLAPRKGE